MIGASQRPVALGYRVWATVTAVTLLGEFALSQPAAAQGRRGQKPATAQPAPASSDSVAPALLDAGQRALAAGDYEGAMQAFLAADDAEPSDAALVGALEAASRADKPLAVVNMAERILARADVSNDARTKASMALASASTRLAQLELVCGEGRCSLEIDGKGAHEGVTYVEPGEHDVRLHDRPETAQRVTCPARAVCYLKLPVTGAQDTVAATSGGPAAPPPKVEPTLQVAPTQVPDQGPVETKQTKPSASAVPMGVFVGASVATGAFAGLATWAGVRALHERNLADTDPAKYDSGKVHHYARMSDYFLISAVGCAGAAVASAIWWVDWSARRQASVAVLPSGGFVSVTQRF